MHETLETCLITSSSKKILTRVKTRLHSPGTVWVVRIVRYVRPVETVTWQDLGPVTWGNIISFGGKKAGQHQQHQQLSLMTFWSRIVSRMTWEIFYLDICQGSVTSVTSNILPIQISWWGRGAEECREGEAGRGWKVNYFASFYCRSSFNRYLFRKPR